MIIRPVFILLAAILVTGCDASEEKKLIQIDSRTSEGRARKDEFYPLYQFAQAFQLDNQAEFFNGLAPGPMDAEQAQADALDGDVGAQTSLFFRLYYGVDSKLAAKHKVPKVTVDVCEAAFWLRHAALREQPTAILWMSYIYARGDGVERDLKTSLRWYLAWLNLYKFDFQEPFPLKLADFGVTPDEYQRMRSELEDWQNKERQNPGKLQDLQKCPGVGPKPPEKKS